MRFTCFDSTGFITNGIWAPDTDFVELNYPPDGGYIEGAFARETHYIDLTDPDNPAPTERPASPVSRTDLTLHDVPVGSTLVINGDSYAAKGTVDLEFPLPGVYSLRVECFPYLDWSDEVTV